MATANFNASLYSTLPTRSVAATLALARALIAWAPKKKLSAGQQKALHKVRESALVLQKAWSEPQAAPKVDLRTFDHTIDVAWRALADRLDAYARLPVDGFPRAARAAELHAILFPEGLAFLTLTYAEEWAESERRLLAIAERKLLKDIIALCGDEFLANVQTAHEAYGQAIGVTASPAPVKGATSLPHPLRALQDAILSYARRIAGEVDEDDPQAVTLAQGALRPFEDFRKSPKRAADPEPEPVDAPIPPFSSPGAPK